MYNLNMHMHSNIICVYVSIHTQNAHTCFYWLILIEGLTKRYVNTLLPELFMYCSRTKYLMTSHTILV